jgi:glycosyltransferase involved in cell wall biosynthesis
MGRALRGRSGRSHEQRYGGGGHDRGGDARGHRRRGDPPGDAAALALALRRLAEDDALRLRLGAAAARVARAHFDLDAYIDRLQSYYQSQSASA